MSDPVLCESYFSGVLSSNQVIEFVATASSFKFPSSARGTGCVSGMLPLSEPLASPGGISSTLEQLLRYTYEQGIAHRHAAPEDIFPKGIIGEGVRAKVRASGA
jgi:hypothetical protein